MHPECISFRHWTLTITLHAALTNKNVRTDANVGMPTPVPKTGMAIGWKPTLGVNNANAFGLISAKDDSKREFRGSLRLNF